MTPPSHLRTAAAGGQTPDRTQCMREQAPTHISACAALHASSSASSAHTRRAAMPHAQHEEAPTRRSEC
jgi:hypothetical protein